jgi:hypothetical protein
MLGIHKGTHLSRCLQDVRGQPHTVAHEAAPRSSGPHSSTQQRSTPTPVVSSIWAWQIPDTSSRLDGQNRRDVCQYHQRLIFGPLLGLGVVSTSRLLVEWCRHPRASSFTVVPDQQRMTMCANCRADEVVPIGATQTVDLGMVRQVLARGVLIWANNPVFGSCFDSTNQLLRALRRQIWRVEGEMMESVSASRLKR